MPIFNATKLNQNNLQPMKNHLDSQLFPRGHSSESNIFQIKLDLVWKK